MTDDAKLWMVRAGRGGVRASLFLEDGMVAVGFSEELGPIAEGTSRDEILERLRKCYPTRKLARLRNAAGQLFRFHFEMQVGDSVVTYDTGLRRYWLGTVKSTVVHDVDEETGLAYRRTVEWTERVKRDALDLATRNTLGSVLTLFCPNSDAAADIRAHAVPIDADESADNTTTPPNQSNDETTDLDALREGIVERSGEFIEDIIASLDPEQMEELLAGILRAMGYRARVSPKGPDRGVDVFASPDGLGLEEPRIFAEVKHRSKPIGAPSIRSFLGGRRAGDRCILLSTAGFTKDAKYEADRANVPLSLVDLPALRELVVDHYEALDVETRQMVPLKRIYWPVSADG